MLIDSDDLVTWMSLMRKEANEDEEAYKKRGDTQAADRALTRASVYTAVIDHVTRRVKKSK